MGAVEEVSEEEEEEERGRSLTDEEEERGRSLMDEEEELGKVEVKVWRGRWLDAPPPRTSWRPAAREQPGTLSVERREERREERGERSHTAVSLQAGCELTETRLLYKSVSSDKHKEPFTALGSGEIAALGSFPFHSPS